MSKSELINSASEDENNGTEESETFFRSSRRRYFVKKGVLKNFAKFTGKRLCRSLYFKSFFFNSVYLFKLLSRK